VKKNIAEITGVELYLFGSSTQNKTIPSDVDVLVVYPDGDLRRGHALAEAIREHSVTELYDVLALSKSEERELGFIDSERAIRIWPPVD
jgi:predicted nucleotidyltransferase